MTATEVVARDQAPGGGPPPALEVDAVTRWYGNVVAVNDISFTAGPGITGLLGPNGAGKSTLLHMMSGLLKPSKGSVRVLGAEAWRNPKAYEELGLVPDREAIYPFLTGVEFVRLSARLHNLPDVEAATKAAIEEVDLADAAGRPVGEYSKGMRQRIKVAASIVHNPRVLLLDEPFNGADPVQRLRMMDLFRQMAAAGRTIIFSSHILEEVERLAENVLVIVSGRLAAAGDFHEIRRLMSDRPHVFTLRTSDDRGLAAALIGQPAVTGVDVGADFLSVRASDFDSLTRLLPRVAKATNVILYEFVPVDESLETVFSYLVKR
jgi:ABC-2 type transport system ATP-binding protein